MAVAIKSTILWTGKTDWEIRRFHGEEYSTGRGTTYNSYLVRDKKTALIDTVWDPFGAEFIERLKSVIDPGDIDYIVANHAEPDHSGGLPALMAAAPHAPVYCTANAVKSLVGHYHAPWNFHPVKTGDRLSLGSRELVFIEAPMLHWPDSMFTYLTVDNTLFSNDAFGQHLATESLFSDLVDRAELFQEAIKYYANILSPFSTAVAKKIRELQSLGLPLEMICPSHGAIWRKDPMEIVNAYAAWAADYQENQITIVYDTMWNGTRKMAEAIARGIAAEDSSTTVKLFNISRSDKNDVATEVFRSKALIAGSPTINRGILSAAAGFMELVRGLGLKQKKASAFGCYGWSGESVKMLSKKLEEAGFELIHEGLRVNWNPDAKELKNCESFGSHIASLFQ